LFIGLAISGIAAWAAIGAGACSSSSQTSGGCPNLDLNCPSSPPSWKTAVQPIVNTYCATGGCHVPGGSSPYDYTNYAGVKANATRMITQLQRCLMPLADASPPPKPLPDADRQTLMYWVTCGAPDN
jgi:hypothetical protein